MIHSAKDISLQSAGQSNTSSGHLTHMQYLKSFNFNRNQSTFNK